MDLVRRRVRSVADRLRVGDVQPNVTAVVMDIERDDGDFRAVVVRGNEDGVGVRLDVRGVSHSDGHLPLDVREHTLHEVRGGSGVDPAGIYQLGEGVSADDHHPVVVLCGTRDFPLDQVVGRDDVRVIVGGWVGVVHDARGGRGEEPVIRPGRLHVRAVPGLDSPAVVLLVGESRGREVVEARGAGDLAGVVCGQLGRGVVNLDLVSGLSVGRVQVEEVPSEVHRVVRVKVLADDEGRLARRHVDRVTHVHDGVDSAGSLIRHRNEHLLTDGVVAVHPDGVVGRAGGPHRVVDLDLILSRLTGVEVYVGTHEPTTVGLVEVVKPDLVIQRVVDGIPVVRQGKCGRCRHRRKALGIQANIREDRELVGLLDTVLDRGTKVVGETGVYGHVLSVRDRQEAGLGVGVLDGEPGEGVMEVPHLCEACAAGVQRVPRDGLAVVRAEYVVPSGAQDEPGGASEHTRAHVHERAGLVHEVVVSVDGRGSHEKTVRVARPAEYGTGAVDQVVTVDQGVGDLGSGVRPRLVRDESDDGSVGTALGVPGQRHVVDVLVMRRHGRDAKSARAPRGRTRLDERPAVEGVLRVRLVDHVQVVQAVPDQGVALCASSHRRLTRGGLDRGERPADRSVVQRVVIGSEADGVEVEERVTAVRKLHLSPEGSV